MLMFEEFFMHSPHNIIGAHCRNSEANVQFGGALRDGNYADVQTGDSGEQTGENSPLTSHAFSKYNDGSDIPLYGRRREHVMFQLSAKEMLNHLHNMFAF